MRLTRRDFGAGAASVALVSGAAQAAVGPDISAALTTYLDAAFEQELQMDPERLTSVGRKEQYGRLRDRSDAAAARTLKWRRQSVADMKARFNPASLSPDAKTSYDIWVLELERAEAREAWRGHNYVFSRGGPHADLPNFLINQHRVDEVADLEAYISRVRALGPVLDELLGQAQRSAAKGVRMPRFAYDQSLAEVTRLTTGAPFGGAGESALLADAKAKIEKLKAAGKVDAGRAERLTADVAQAMTSDMKPSYDRLAAWLREDRERAPAAPRGVGTLPDGAAYYSAMLRLQTTTDMSAEAIHQLGLAEVARLRAEMEALMRRIGFAGTLEAFFAFLRTDPQFYLPNTEAGRQQYLATARVHLAEMKTRLPQYFGRLPKADLIVKRVEAFREEPGGAARYSRGARDGSRPGTFYVHLSDTGATPTYELEGTAYHEGLPGHHMQISIAQELNGLPVFRTQYGYGAYAEGWGLYVEALAKEMGFYVDPYSDFGRLSREIWRAIRLVVDTGLHAKGWSEAEALAFYSANSPQPPAKIRSEIRRYLVQPGQATAYKVGMVRILAIRERARVALGSKFNAPAFHDAVLGGGSLPLSVLDARIDRWIAERRVA